MESTPETFRPKYTSIEDIPEIHARVWKTFKSGVTIPLAYRRRQLLQLARLLRENASILVDALHHDLKKPKQETVLGDVEQGVFIAVQAAESLEEWSKPEKPALAEWRSNWDGTIFKVPKGPSLLIVPWNYPVGLLTNPLIGAIAAGCPCVIKTSELAPAAAAVVASLFPKYLDPEAYVVVNGEIPQNSKLLEMKWAHIFFTGGLAVGRIVAAAAAKHVTPCTLELGSKTPVIIDEDFDDMFLAAKRILNGKGTNAGQICVSPDYVLVPRKRLAEVTAAFKKAYEALWPQSQLHPDTEWSKIINTAHFDRLRNLLEATRGEVILGGEHDEKEGKIALTVVKVEGIDDPLVAGYVETFGPILSLVPVDDLNEAIDIINGGPVPLVIYAFTNSESLKEKLLLTTRSGNLTFNDTLTQLGVYELPFGGQGESGYGQYFGRYSFDVFTHRRTYVNVPPAIEPFLAVRYPPYTEEGYRAMVASMTVEIPDA